MAAIFNLKCPLMISQQYKTNAYNIQSNCAKYLKFATHVLLNMLFSIRKVVTLNCSWDGHHIDLESATNNIIVVRRKC